MSETIQIPILFEFDQEKIIGYVQINKEYEKLFPRFSLTVGYIERKERSTELVTFGLVQHPRPL